MKNTEKKKVLFEKFMKQWSHLTEYCTIDVMGLDDDNVYFHPTFKIAEGVYISSQADVVNNNTIYALNFNMQEKGICIEIYEGLLDSVIVGFHTNKEAVLVAMDTLAKVKTHVNMLNSYCIDYVNNILIGESLEEVSKSLINEIKTVNQVVAFMKKSLLTN